MSVCPAGELVGGEDPLTCRKWYDPTPCRPPSVLGPYTKGVYLSWYASQRWNRCSANFERCASKALRCPHKHLADLVRTGGLTCLVCGEKVGDCGEDYP